MITKFKRKIKIEKIISSNFFHHQRLSSDFHIKCKDYKYWSWIISKYEAFSKQSYKKKIVPKIIHQIWIGKKFPKKYQKWRNSWIKNNPGYKYFLWDEKKILQLGLINYEQFSKATNVATKSDIARYEILYKFGGIYVDSDFESLKKINEKFLTRSFVAGQLFGYKPEINNALIIASKGSKLLELIIKGLGKYPGRLSPTQILSYCGAYYITNVIRKNRRILNDILILPSQYFYPWPSFMLNENRHRYDFVSKKTYALHHWEVSWQTLSTILYAKLNQILSKYFKN
jgi:hypothetical protein